MRPILAGGQPHRLSASPILAATALILVTLGASTLASTLASSSAVAQSAFDEQFFGQRRSYGVTRYGPERRPYRSVREARPRRAPVVREAAPARPAKPPAQTAFAPPAPLVAIISLQHQQMKVYGAEGEVAQTRVSTGMNGHRTPAGIFSIIQRNRYHHSNIYSGAPMPFMQRITWSGIALHEGVVPGYPASHGCIRLPSGFASQMWGMGRIGMRVIIAPDDVAPQPIKHVRLPVPVTTPVPQSADVRAPLQTASTTGEPVALGPALLSPFRLAHVRRTKAQNEKVEAEKAVKPAHELAAERAEAANRAAQDLRAAAARLAQAQARVAALKARLGPMPGAAADIGLVSELGAAEVALSGIEAEHAGVQGAERRASDAAFDAVKAAKDAVARAEAAAEAAKLAAVALEPVSIFVSRKDGKIYVRQGFVPIHEEEIAIAEPERPLGTHVYTAMGGAAIGDELAWISVTLPAPPPRQVAERSNRRGRDKTPVAAEPPQPTLPPSTAATALDRFVIPEATRRLIADRLWQGASLIVSDYPASNETGRGTDFIVLPK